MRTTRKTRLYDLRFREDAVALLNRSDRSFEEIAKSLGVPRPTLYNWYRRDMAKKGKKPAVGRGHVDAAAETAEDKVARLQAENEALKKRVASLEEDREILKKFAAFSVKENT